MKFLLLQNRSTTAVLFLLLLGYLIFRMFFVGIYIDEAFTFLDYIEPNNLWESIPNPKSANNHLLVTYIGSFFYKMCGYQLFWLRFASLIAFCIYFFTSRFLVLKSLEQRYQLIVFIALNTVTWIFEYFGFVRGYGLALAFLFAAISILFTWFNTRKPVHFIILLFCLWLSVFSNLAFINSVLILIGCILLFILFYIRSINWKHLLYYGVALILLAYFLLPLIQYSFELKNAGALWWGDLSGFWAVTGDSLTKLTFGISNVWFKYFCFLLIILFIIRAIYLIRINGIMKFIFSIEGVIFTLFIGNLMLIEFLAIFFKVNYPKDRTAMYLVIEAIFLFSLMIQHLRFSKIFMMILLFFPIVFILKLNLFSSQYQQNYRVSNPVRNYLKFHLNDDVSYSIYESISPSLNLELRKFQKVYLYNYNTQFPQNEPNLLLIDRTEDTQFVPNYYSLEMLDNSSGVAIYKDNRKHSEVLVKDTLFSWIDFSLQDFGLLNNVNIKQLIGSSKFSLKVNGTIESLEGNNSLMLYYSMFDNGQCNETPIQMSLSQCANNFGNLEFNWKSPIFSNNYTNPEIHLFFSNANEAKFRIKNLRVQLYKVD